MQLSVSSVQFRDAIAKILTVVDKRNSKAILTSCLIFAENNHLKIMATDLEVSAKLILPCEVIRSGKFCISAKNIYEILKELPDSALHLSFETEKNLINIKCEDVYYSLVVTSTDEFPLLSFQNNENQFSIKSEDLINIINKTSHAISNDETRLYLNGIFIQEINGKIRAVATDGHRLALYETSQVEGTNNALKNGIIIPKKGVFELKKIAETFPDKFIKMSLDDSFIYIDSNNEYFLSIRLISKEFVKYQAVIPAKTVYKLSVDKEHLSNALKRIKILANEKSNSVRLSLKPELITISASHPSLGDASEKIQTSYSGKDIEIGFNAKYLLDTLSVLSGEEINLEINNELSPVLVKSTNSPDFLGIVMPLKI